MASQRDKRTDSGTITAITRHGCGRVLRWGTALWTLLLLALVAPSEAGTFTWDNSGGSPLNDGGGNWNATGGTNWYDGVTYGAWGNASSDTAVFGVGSGAAGTITVGSVNVGNITFNASGSGNYTLSGGTISLASAGVTGTIAVNSTGTTTISSAISGQGNLTKTGSSASLLVLSGANSFSGTTTVQSGTIRLGNNNALQNSTLNVVAGAGYSNAVAAVSGGTYSVGMIVGSGTLALGSNTLYSVGGSNLSGTFAGVMGAGSAINVALIKVGTGTWTISGIAWQSGGVTVNGGLLDLTGNANANSAGVLRGAVTVNEGATLRSSGSWSLGNAATLTANVQTLTLNSGTLDFGAASSGGLFGTGTMVTMTAGAITGKRFTLQSPSGSAAPIVRTLASSSRASITSGMTLSLGGTNSLVTTFDIARGTTADGIDFALENGINRESATVGGGILKTGSGTMLLSGAGDYQGTTTIRAGTLITATNAPHNATGAFGSATSAIVVGDASTAAGDTIRLLAGAGVTIGRNIDVGSQGAGTTLGGSGTSGIATYSGAITLNKAVTLQAATGGTVDFTGTWTTNNNSVTIGSPGNAGTVRLSSAFSSTGDLTVNAGTLQAAANTLANTSAIAVNGATLSAVNYNSSASLALNSSGLATISGTGLSLSGDVTNGNTAADALDFSSTSGTLGLTSLSGAGNTRFRAGASIGGTVSQGSVRIDGVGSLGTVSGGTIALNGASASITTLSGGRIDLANNVALSVQDGTFGGSINGSGSLTKTGAGGLTLAGSNGYTGATTMKGGTLSLGVNGSFASSATITVGDAGSSGVVLDLTAKSSGYTFGAGQTVKGIGTIQMASGKSLTIDGTLAAGNSPGTLTISGGDLVLGGSSITNYEISGADNTVGSGINDLTRVAGSLTLGGTLNVLASPSFDVFGNRTYRVFDYATGGAGALSGSMTIGSTPDATYLYSLTNTSTTVNLFVQRRADQASTFTMTAGATRALVNSTVTVSGSVSNSSPSGAASLALGLGSTGLSGTGFTTGSVSPLGSVAVSGALNAGATVGVRTWSVTNTDANAITTVSTATGAITVVNDRAFTSSTIAFGRFLNTSSALASSAAITSLGLTGTTADATINGFGSSNGLSLSLTNGTNVFNGASGTQTATYIASGSYTGGLGAVSNSFTGTATNEFGNTSTVGVVYTGTAFEAASIAQNQPSAGNAGTISITNAAGTYRSAAYVASTSLTGHQGWSVTGFGTGDSAAAGATLAGTAHFNAAGLLSGTYTGLFAASLQNDQTLTGASANDLGSLTWNLSEVVLNTTGSGQAMLAANAILNTVSLTSGTGAGASLASFAAGQIGASPSEVIMSFTSGSTGQYSDILHLQGTDGLAQVLQLTYDPSLLGSTKEASLILGWLDTRAGSLTNGQWINSVLGNSGTNGVTMESPFLGSWASYVSQYGKTAATALGAFGVDTTNKTVWAAINHNSQFVVIVPEPDTIIFAGIGIAMAGWSLWKRRRIARILPRLNR